MKYTYNGQEYEVRHMDDYGTYLALHIYRDGEGYAVEIHEPEQIAKYRP